MTRMRPLLPNPNDERSIEVHKQSILNSYAAVFEAIDSALRESAPRARELFKLMEGPVDLAVHACNTRYLAKVALRAKQVQAEDEDEATYEIQRVPNCGLCIRLAHCEIRILKAGSDGVPKASSDARSRFYSSNQLVLQLAQNADKPDPQPVSALGLVVLWDVDRDLEYSGMQIACPRGERENGTVDCFWIVQWQRRQGTAARRTVSPGGEQSGSDSDFVEEIRPLDKGKTRSS